MDLNRNGDRARQSRSINASTAQTQAHLIKARGRKKDSRFEVAQTGRNDNSGGLCEPFWRENQNLFIAFINQPITWQTMEIDESGN